MSESARPSHRSGPILVVDDDQTLREFVCMALAEQGYETLAAADGLQALDAARTAELSLVLTDVGIPLLNGRQLVAELHLAQAGVPCIVMSGSRPDDEMLGCEAVRGYLAKPFDIDELFELVTRFVDAPEPSIS